MEEITPSWEQINKDFPFYKNTTSKDATAIKIGNTVYDNWTLCDNGVRIYDTEHRYQYFSFDGLKLLGLEVVFLKLCSLPKKIEKSYISEDIPVWIKKIYKDSKLDIDMFLELNNLVKINVSLELFVGDLDIRARL